VIADAVKELPSKQKNRPLAKVLSLPHPSPPLIKGRELFLQNLGRTEGGIQIYAIGLLLLCLHLMNQAYFAGNKSHFFQSGNFSLVLKQTLINALYSWLDWDISVEKVITNRGD
jgi:hypothetical protein